MPEPTASRIPGAKAATVAIFLGTTLQLLFATLFSDLPRYEGKGFGARLIAYPLLMLLVPLGWWVLDRRAFAGGSRDVPWLAFALVMTPFFVDVNGNSANLYDSVTWWDDANHFVNWCLLCGGLGLLLARTGALQSWALGLAISGLGALLAVGWELGEWYAFIRHGLAGTELATAYEDTLFDEVLGTLGGTLAAVLVVRSRRVSRPAPGEATAA